MLADMKSLALLQPFRRAVAARPLAEFLLIWLGRARTRRQLRELDDRALADIGLDRPRRDAECARWGWQGRSLDV